MYMYDMNVKGELVGTEYLQEGSGGKENVMDGEYDQSTS
jgi:hypothetical protein